MKILRLVCFLAIFVATWFLCSYLMGQTVFKTSDLIAMCAAGLGAYLGARWREHRHERLSHAC